MKINELNEKLGDLNRELAIANYRVLGREPAKPWTYAVFAIMFLAAILVFKPQLTALVTHSNDFSFETVTIPEDAMVVLTANGVNYEKAVKDILYYYPTESAAIGTQSVIAYKALLVAKPAQFGISAGDYTITANLMWKGQVLETITKEVSVGQADVFAGQARAQYDAQVKKDLADEEKKRAEEEKRFAATHFDPETEKARIEGKIKNTRFKVDRVDKIANDYEVDMSDNGQPMVNFKGLKDTTQLSEVQKFNFQGRKVDLKDKPDEKAEIRSEALYVNNISINSADVTLFKSGPVNAILYCGEADWNINLGDCSLWQTTNIPFNDLGDRISFTVSHFTTYAGGWVNQSVSLDNNINNNLVFYRTTNSFNNLTLAKADVWNATFNPTSSNSESLYGVAVDASGVYLAGHDSSPGVGNEQWHAEKRDLNDGSLIWNATSNPSSNTDYIYGVAVDASGVYLAGHDTSPGNAQWRVEKRNLSTGLIIWNTTSNPSSSNDYIYGVAVDASGVYLAGQESSSSGQGRIEKRNLTDGSLIWNATNPTTNTVIYGVAVDSSGVYLAGYDFLLSVEFQWLIEKRNLTDGSLIWNATSNPSSSTDFVYGVAVDSSGVYLGGQDSSPGVVNRQWRAEKRNLTDGSLIWNATSNPSSSDEGISGVAVDSSGVYLAGYDSSSNGQWRVEKRNLSTGSSIWNATSNPSANSDILQGVAVDASGVYLVGRDWSPGDYQWRAEKRNKNDGSQNSTTYFDSGTYTQSLRANNNQSVIWDRIYYSRSIPGFIINNQVNQSKTGTGTPLPDNEGEFNVTGSVFQNTNQSNGVILASLPSSCTNTNDGICFGAPCYEFSCDFCNCGSSELTCTNTCGGTWNAGGYSSVGNYTSFLDSGLSSGDTYGWNNLSWTTTAPAGTNITFKIKTSATNASAPDFSSGTCEANDTAGNETINLTGCVDLSQRYLWYKAILKTNDSANTPLIEKVEVNVNSTNWTGNISYQVATSDDNSTWSSFMGPGQSASAYYSYSAQALNASNSRFLQYRFYLSTTNTSVSPILSNITVKYDYPTTDNGSVSSDTTQLVIWDSSDLGSYGNYVTFYANLTNFTSGLPINGTDINCTLSENSTGSWSAEENMPFNDTNFLYSLSKSLSGPASFRVFCNGTAASGFADVNISEPTQGVISICDEGDLSTECNVTTGHAITSNNYVLQANNLRIRSGGILNATPGTNSFSISLTGDLSIEEGGKIETSAGAGQTAGNITIGANTTIISGNLSSKAFCTSNNCNENKTMNAGQIKITGSRLIIEGNLESVSYCSSGQFCNYATNYEKSIIQAGNITISSTSINLTGLIRTDGYCNGTSCNYANGGIGGDFNSNLRGGAIIINTTNITATSNLSAQAYCTGATCSQQCYHNTYINSGKITIYADNLDTTGTISTAGYCNGTNCATNEVCGIGSTYINGGQISINTASGLAIEKIDVSSNDLGGDYGSRRGGLINISASTQFSDDMVILNAYGENAYGNITFVSPKFNMTGSLSVYNISIDSSGNLLVRNSSYISYNASGSKIQAGGNITIDTYGSLAVGNFSYGDSISILGNLTTDSPGIVFSGYAGGSVVAGYGSIMNLGDENLIVPRGQTITVTTIYAKNITALGKIILTGSDINADNLWVNDTVFASNVNVSGLINITSSGTLSALNITATEILNSGIINNTQGNLSMTINLTGNLSILAGGRISTSVGAGQTAGNITILADILNNSGNITSRGGSCVGNGCVIGGSGLISVQSNSIYISGLIRTAGTNLTATTAWSFGGHAGNMRINSTSFSLLQGGSLNLDGGIVSSTTYNDPARYYGGNGGVLNLTAQRIAIQGSVNAKGGRVYSTNYVSWGYGGTAGNVNTYSDYETNITNTIDVSGGEVSDSIAALIYGSSGGSINIIAQTLNLNSSITSSGGYASSTNGGTPGSGGSINLNVTTLNSYSNSLMNVSGGKVFVGGTCTGGNGGAINVIAENISAEKLNLLPIYGTGCIANGAYGTIVINSSLFNASGKFSAYNISIDNTGSLTIPAGGYISTDAASSLINIQSANNLTIALGGAIRSTSSGSINITLPGVYFAPFGNITSASGNIYLNLPNFQNTSQSIYDNGAVINPAPWLYPDYLNCSLFNGNDVVFRIKCNLNGTYQFNNPQITNGSSVYVIGQTIINANNTVINNSAAIYGQHNLTINSENLSITNSSAIYFNMNSSYHLLLNLTNNLFIDSGSNISSTVGTSQTGPNFNITADTVNITGNIISYGGGCVGTCSPGSGGSLNLFANKLDLYGIIEFSGSSLTSSTDWTSPRGGNSGTITINSTILNTYSNSSILQKGGDATLSGKGGGLSTYGGNYGGNSSKITLSAEVMNLNGIINGNGGSGSYTNSYSPGGRNYAGKGSNLTIYSRNYTSINGTITLSGGGTYAHPSAQPYNNVGGDAGYFRLFTNNLSLNASILLVGGMPSVSYSTLGVGASSLGGQGGIIYLNATSLIGRTYSNLSGGNGINSGGTCTENNCNGGNGGTANIITNNMTLLQNNLFIATYGIGTNANGTNGIINITKDSCSVPGGIFNPNPNVTYSQPCYLNVTANINQTKFFAGQTGRIWGNAIFGDGVNASNYTARISIDGVNRVNATTNWYGIYNTTVTFDATQTVGQNGLLANVTTYTITNWSSSGIMEFWKMTKTVFNTPFNIIYDAFGRYNISAGLFRLDMNNQTIINNFTGGSASNVIAD